MKIKCEKIAMFMISLLVIKTMLIYSEFFKLPKLFENIIEIITFGYLLLDIFLNAKIRKKKLFILYGITLLTLYTSYTINSYIIFSSFVLMMAAYVYDKNKIINTILKTMMIVILIHFMLYFYQLIIGKLQYTTGINGRPRCNLGFVYPNISGTYCLWCFLAFSTLNKDNLKRIWIAYILLFLIFLFNGTRTMIYCSTLFMILLYLNKVSNFKKYISYISKYIFVFLTILIIFLVAMHKKDNYYVEKIDEWLSYRISYSAQAIENYGYTFLGEKHDDVEVIINGYKGNLIMDVTYTYILYCYGVIYIILLSLLAYYTSTKNEEIIKILVIVWAIYAFFELYSLNFSICFPLLYGADLIGGKNDTKSN